jgi:FkbM family methyltransferase
MTGNWRLFGKALSFPQVVKRIAIKLFRLQPYDVAVNSILDFISRAGFKVRASDFDSFEVTGGLEYQSMKFDLRKGSSDLQVFNQVMVLKEYQTIIDFVSAHYRPEKITSIVDAGANIGLTSLYFHRFFPSSKILAIEAAPDNFVQLQKNILLNNALNIIPIHRALWFEKGMLKISNNFRDRQQWSTQVGTSGTAEVSAVTLEEAIKIGALLGIDILKIDIEGAEKFLLTDDSFLKHLAATKFIAIEIHEEAVDRIQVIGKLQSLGFELLYKGETLFGVNKGVL